MCVSLSCGGAVLKLRICDIRTVPLWHLRAIDHLFLPGDEREVTGTH